MIDPSSRRGVTPPRTLGRGFWIGLLASLAFHAALMSSGAFRIPQVATPPPLEARLEIVTAPSPQPVETAKATAKPSAKPARLRKPARPLPPPAQQASEQASADIGFETESASEVGAAEAEAAAAEFADEDTAHQASLPLSELEPAPVEQQPHTMLTKAATKLNELPPQLEIVYELKGLINGRQTHVWHRQDQRYTLKTTMEATGLVGVFVSGKITQTSTGRIGELGLLPERFETRRLEKKEILVFDYSANLIEAKRMDPKRGQRSAQLPLLTGTQDQLSSIYQLAMIAQDDGQGLLVLATAKKVKGYPYRVNGKEVLQSPWGALNTLHVTRAEDSGKGAWHLWLAPDKYFLPIKISYTDEDGREWVLLAQKIRPE